MTVSLNDINVAAAKIKGSVVRTPMIRADALSNILGAEIHMKLETLQRTGSFKDRGALVKLLSLTPEQAKRGVIAISAGNHAQGVAHHSQRLGIPATIVMPEGTPFNKIARTKALGAKVELFGDNINAAEPFANDIMESELLTFIHPYNDEKIIAGQGTIGVEMLADVPGLEVIIAPIGGGGLISGVATAAKSLKPDIQVIGAEAALYPSMYQALHGVMPTSGGASVADGIAVSTPGELTLEIIRRLVDDIVLVDEPAIETAIQTMLSEAKILSEGAGAVALAALSNHPSLFTGKSIGLIVSGANIDPRILASVSMRGMVRAGQLARLRVTISDRPGALADVSEIIGDSGGNIVEIFHQRLFYDLPVKLAYLDVVVESRDTDHIDEILGALGSAGFAARRLADTDHAG